jgi:hypothetical protein
MFFPWALATYKDAIERFDNPGLIIATFHKFQDESEFAGITAGSFNAEVWDDHLQSAAARYRLLMVFAIRMDLMRECGGFVEENDVAADGQDLFLRIGTAKGFVYISAPTVYAYRQHATAQSRYPEVICGGARVMLARERRDVYPGGEARCAERSIFLARMLKYSVERCIEQGGIRYGCELYLRGLPYFRRTDTWPYNVRPLAFIKGFPRRIKRGPKRPAKGAGTRGRSLKAWIHGLKTIKARITCF